MLRTLSLALLMSTVSACGPKGTGGTGGGSGGSGGGTGGVGGGGGSSATPGWSLKNSGYSPIIDVEFQPAPSGGGTPFVPDIGDTWWQNMTDRTFDLSRDDGAAHGEGHLTLAISGDTITVTGSASATGGVIKSSVLVNMFASKWCYTPATAASRVHITIDASQSPMPTATGYTAGASWSFKNFGKDCDAFAGVSQNQFTSGMSCTSSSLDVAVNSSGVACINEGMDPVVGWLAGGGNGLMGTDGTGSLTTKFVITATPMP